MAYFYGNRLFRIRRHFGPGLEPGAFMAEGAGLFFKSDTGTAACIAACCADHRAWNPGAGGGRTYFPWTFICKDPADASGMGECADSFSDFCTVSWKYDSDPVCLSDGNYSDAFV